MCLIVFAWRVIPGMPLIACANRDEFYDRPATPAGPWPDNPDIIAGRDLQGGGSWMGVTRHGPHGPKFAALTNIRAPGERRDDAPTRGALVADYLKGDLDAPAYLARIVFITTPLSTKGARSDAQRKRTFWVQFAVSEWPIRRSGEGRNPRSACGSASRRTWAPAFAGATVSPTAESSEVDSMAPTPWPATCDRRARRSGPP